MLAVCSVALSAPFTVLAQDAGAPPPPPHEGHEGRPGGPGGHMSPMDSERQLQMMTKHLKLTDDQQKQIQKILADNDAQMKALMEERMAKVRATLTPEQQKKMDAMHEHMKEHMKDHQHDGPDGAGAPPPPPPPGQ